MRYEIYRTLALLGGRWRWRLVASNGRKIAVSGEGYHNKQDCRGWPLEKVFDPVIRKSGRRKENACA